jgi:hypothetical protein
MDQIGEQPVFERRQRERYTAAENLHVARVETDVG